MSFKAVFSMTTTDTGADEHSGANGGAGGSGNENQDYDEYTDSQGDGAGGDDPEKAPLQDEYEEDNDDIDDDELLYDMMETGVPAPPDGGWGWVIVFASFMCNLIVDGIAYTFGVFIGEFATSFNEEKGTVSWVGSLLCGVYLTVGPIVSALTNKFGCRIVCIAGSIIACIGFALSSLCNSIGWMILAYGITGGIGFGMIYLPAVVCVSYYFESKRALATGLAVCGSGVGTFVFAPFAQWLLQVTDWRKSNLIFAGLIFCCSFFGALMRPLEITRVEDDGEFDENDENEDIENGPGVQRNHNPRRTKPLLQRMAEEKRNYLERGSLAGSSYFMVQLPDGTMERRMKLPLNVDPGVHSSFNLDQLVPGTPITPVPTLPTITEADQKSATATDSANANFPSAAPLAPKIEDTIPEEDLVVSIPEPIAEEEEENNEEESEGEEGTNSKSGASNSIPINSQRRHSDGTNSQATTPSSSFKTHDMGLSKSPTKPIPVRVGSVTSSGRGMPRNGSAPQFITGRSIPKNGSVPLFDKIPGNRRQSYKAVPLGSSIRESSMENVAGKRVSSKSNLNDGHRRGSGNFKNSMASFGGSKMTSLGVNQEDDYNSLWSKGELSEGLVFGSSRKDSEQYNAPPPRIIRPLSRKDIFYSGSIVHLPEYQSQKSIASYRQSILNLPKAAGAGSIAGSVMTTGPGGVGQEYVDGKAQPGACCPWLSGGAFKAALGQLMDFNLLKNPVFLFVAISNVFGMLGFYVPFVYLIESAKAQNIDKDKAAFLLSIIGITNTIGRILSGIISDLPQVSALFMNNCCLLLSGICVAAVPFCASYEAYVAIGVFFGLFVSGYISLTSIIIVELLGLENLTNAFGLLILFRGAASIVGPPLAGAVYDAVKDYQIPFFMAGGFLIISAIISFMVPFVVRCAPPKPVLEPRHTPGTFLEDIPEDEDESYRDSGNQSIASGNHGNEKVDHVESCL